MNNFLIACGVSFVARVLTHPFDTLKVGLDVDAFEEHVD
jgi:hypothetical protein